MERKIGTGAAGLRPREAVIEERENKEGSPPPAKPKVRFADEDSFQPIAQKAGRERERVRTPTADDLAQEREFDANTPSMSEAQRKALRTKRPILDEVKLRTETLAKLAASEPDSEKDFQRLEKAVIRSQPLVKQLEETIARLSSARDQAKALGQDSSPLDAQLAEASSLKAELNQALDAIEDHLEDFWADTGTPSP